MYRFKSRAAGDLIMLEPNGRQIMGILGKPYGPGNEQGILVPEDMPGAIAALEAAVAHDEAERARLTKEAQSRGEPAPRFEGISLRLRALPFIEMLRRCHRAEREIVWGV